LGERFFGYFLFAKESTSAVRPRTDLNISIAPAIQIKKYKTSIDKVDSFNENT